MIRLTVRQMEYFAALAETLHFGRAAELAGVTQPALSAQVAEMERRLGCRLFERGRGGVRLTEEARILGPRIESILAEMRDLEMVARRGRRPMQGRFRLGIIPTIAPFLLPSLLPAARAQYPDLRLELREAITATLVEETSTGRLDGLIAALPVTAPGLAVTELFKDRFFLAVPQADQAFDDPPVPPESPELERLMLLEEGHCLRDQALAVCGAVKPVAMASYGATSLTTLLQMVSHGFGITLIPEMAVGAGSEAHDCRIVPFAEPMPSRTVCMAWRANGPRKDECASLAELIRSVRRRGPARPETPPRRDEEDRSRGCAA